MMENEIVSGRQFAWSLLHKLGEGDAGEVFRVETLSGGGSGILKRPRKSTFAGDVFRQSAQIRTEAQILAALAAGFATAAPQGVRVPALLDQSKPEADFNARNFIVIEGAPGIDLATLGRVAQLGLTAPDEMPGDPGAAAPALLQSIARTGAIPNRILLTILLRLSELLERIHVLPSDENGSAVSGIVWNDVKPDHLFWQPLSGELTVIDWGNARFLAQDRATEDRQFSWLDDFRQFYEEMGRFLGSAAPDLLARLDWPQPFTPDLAGHTAVLALQYRVQGLLKDENERLAVAREEETLLLQSSGAGEDTFTRMQAVQAQILEFGELPDYAAALRFSTAYAAQLVAEDRLEELRRLVASAVNLPAADGEQWRLVGQLARIPGRSEGQQRLHFLAALQAALARDWPGLLWEMVSAIQGYAEPDWWQDLTATLRRLALGPEGEVIRPLVAVRRLTFALQAAARRLEERDLRAPAVQPALDRLDALASRLRSEVSAHWTALDPAPPDGGLDYAAVEPLLNEAAGQLPTEQRAVRSLLAAPKAQVQRVLEAWAIPDFEAACAALRSLLLWDPDRWRVLRAERAILSASDFLNRMRQGPRLVDNFPGWITDLEFQGRELRNQVGPAPWLDAVLETCKLVRKGGWPSDLLRARPALLIELPWLARFERGERLPLLSALNAPEPQTVIRPILGLAPLVGEIHGVVEGWLGPEGSVALTAPLDAWMPEARGSSARVVNGALMGTDAQRREAAIKLMRMDQVHYALPLFREEVTVLTVMNDVPGVSRLVECGFFKLDDGGEFPLVSAAQAPLTVGRVLRIGPDSTKEYLDRLNERIEDGWTPYLALEKQIPEDSLLTLCDAGMTRGQFLPTVTLLQMGVQICEILQIAHERKIVYRDHKILHYYWQARANAIYFIDWNVARFHPGGLSEHEIHMDLVQFGARGLHHILTGRTAPGALPLGPTRPEEIEQAADSYKTQWTYDDQRLSAGLRGLLERVLAGEYHSAAELGADLKRALMQLPAG